jgi:hypothetical protein
MLAGSVLVFFVEFKEYEGKKKLLLFFEPLHFCGIFACLSLKYPVNCILWGCICTDTVNISSVDPFELQRFPI